MRPCKSAQTTPGCHEEAVENPTSINQALMSLVGFLSVFSVRHRLRFFCLNV